MNPPRAAVVLAALALAAAGLALRAQPTPATAVVALRDVTYVSRPTANGAIDLKMNIVVPAGSEGKKLPCILCIHGGGWQAGRREELDQLTRILAERGFVAATVSYRFAPEHKHPAQTEDCAQAVRFLRTHAAEYHLDQDRIGAVGFSAGAHLAMMLAVGDPGDGFGMEAPADTKDAPSAKVQAAVSYFGPTNLAAADIPQQSIGIVAALIGKDPEGWKDRCDKASPFTYLGKGDSPMLLFNGTGDPLVPHTQAFTMIEAMGKVGVPGRIEVIAGAGHGFGGSELLRTLEATVAFFSEHLPAKPGK